EELEIINQGLSQVFSAGLSLEICITTLAQHYEECVSKSSPDAVVCSAPAPDHCAAQAAPQSLPASDLTLAPLVCQDNTSQTSSQAFHTKAAAQQQLVSASLADGGSPVRVLHIPSAAQELPEALQREPETSQPLLQSEPTTFQPLLHCSSPVVKLGATETSEDDSEEEINRRSEEGIRRSLNDICTEPAARLCLGELAVVQKSMQLIGTGEDMLSVQILEDAHRVDLKDLNSCTCHFNQAFQVPCRHILAVLNSNRKPSQPEVPSRPRERGCDAHQAGQDNADGLLEVLKSSWDKSLDKSQVVSFLKAEISQRLTHCGEEEFEHRYKTLRELADSWIGPSAKVKL
ncbi:ZSWM1 protein, partial [Serilophus lunatus]|nr:ZSWM1 protein [Serilophus lunatus]